MELEEVETFGHLLRELVTTSTRIKLFKDKFSIILLPREVQLPFTVLTGPQKNQTVVVSKYTPPAIDSSSFHSESLIENTREDSENESFSSIQSPPAPQTLPLPEFKMESVQIVHVGQSGVQSKVCLPSSHGKTESQPTNQICQMPLVDISEMTPISLDEARYIASLYNLSTKNNPSLPNLWILCTSEKQKIVSIGGSFTNSTLYSYTIKQDEPVPLSEANKKGVAKQPQWHYTGPVLSQYAISGSSKKESEEAGSLVVEFTWTEPDRPLGVPPESAHASIRVSAKPGYLFSPVLATHTELTTLLTLCEIHTGTSDWPMAEQPGLREQVPQRIESFLSDVESPLSQVLDTTVISPNADSNVYEMRKDLDFAERLWMFAKDVTSLTELQEIFAAIFKALLLGRVQPFVHRGSMSTLAVLLRQLLLCASTEERQALASRYQSLLSHTKLLPCLIQIGLEKMKRDYRTFFISSDIATDDQLDDFVSTSPSQTQLSQCHTLCRLHCVLEINASLLSFLNLPSSVLSSLTKTALQVYKKTTFKSFSATPTFVQSLPPYSASLKSIIALCSKLSPIVWKATLKSGGMILYHTEPLYRGTEDTDTDCYYVYKAVCDIVCM